MWSRRGFLGTFLGTVAAGAFYAMLPSDPFQCVNLPYRMTFFGPGYEFQAPGVKRIERVEGGFTFVAEPLDLFQTGIVSGVSLYTPDGRFVSSGNFNSTVHVVNGDQLKVTYTLKADRRCDSPEELVGLCLSHRT